MRKLLFYSTPLGLFLFIFTFKAIDKGYSDFAAYYFGSTLLLQKNYQDVYENHRFNQIIQNEGYKGLFVSFTPFPPFTSIVIAPFTLMPVGVSKTVFNLLSSLLFIFSLARDIKHFSLPAWLYLLVPLLFFTALRNNIYFGQSYLLLFVFLLEGYIAFEKKQLLLCSLLWGAAIVFKIFPAVIIFFLIFRKEYRQTAFLLAASLLLFAVSVMVNGIASWEYYLTELLPRLNNGELNNSFTYLFQSAHMLLKNIFVSDELLNPGAPYNSPYLFVLTLGLFKIAIVSAGIMVTLQQGSKQFLVFACWIGASILLSPNGSTYSLILWLFMLLALYASGISFKLKALATVLVFLICNLPVHWFQDFPLLFRFPRLYLMLTLFALLVLSAQIRFNYKVVSAVLIVFIPLESLKLLSMNESDKSTYLLQREKYLLIYDYRIENRMFVYTYWTDAGKGEERSTVEVYSFDLSGLSINNQQIYYKGKIITFSSDRKMKPALINSEYIVYLSDKNRGVGMYTLRKIRIGDLL